MEANNVNPFQNVLKELSDLGPYRLSKKNEQIEE